MCGDVEAGEGAFAVLEDVEVEGDWGLGGLGGGGGRVGGVLVLEVLSAGGWGLVVRWMDALLAC